MPQKKNKDLKSIEAAGGVVFRLNGESEQIEVLLIHRLGTWDIPKGKLEKGESIEMCAAREVAEECGTILPIILKNLGTTYHEYVQNETEYGKTTYWFAMVFPQPLTNNDFTAQAKEGIKEVAWYPLSKAKGMVGFENLKEVLNRFEKWFNSLT